MYYFYKAETSSKLYQFYNDVCNYFEFIFTRGNKGYTINWHLYTNITKNIDALFNTFINIYNTLNGIEKWNVLKAYICNRDINRITKGRIKPIPYTNINSKIRQSLKDIDDYLYDNALKWQSLDSSLKDLYEAIRNNSISTNQVCPFCGLERMENVESDIREDFDHFLLRSQYPFTTINLFNLIPMCKKCNQSYKKETDISSMGKIFYPFTENFYSQLDFEYKHGEFNILNSQYEDEILNWETLFKVKKRSSIEIKNSSPSWYENDIESIVNSFEINRIELISKKVKMFQNEYSNFSHLKYAFFKFLLEG